MPFCKQIRYLGVMDRTTRARLDVAIEETMRDLDRGRIPAEALNDLVYNVLRISSLDRPAKPTPKEFEPPAPGPWEDEETNPSMYPWDRK